MILPDTFHFLRPAWLAALLPLAGILWLMARRRRRGGGWAEVCEPALLPHVLIGGLGPARSLPTVLTALAGTLAILALAGPVWRELPQPVYSGGGALVIALDLSRSMDAGDLQPSRLVRARFRLADILTLRREGQTALLAFAGDAFTVTPLTDDVETIRSQLGALSTDIMPAQGSRGDKALALAGDLLRQAGLAQGDVLLVTDEVSPLRGVEAARALREAGFRVSVLGVGTDRGAPIPAGDGGFLKSDTGEIVIPRLDESVLRDVADAGGGRYARLAIDNSDLETLADVLTGAAAAASESARTRFHADVWREEGPWLVLLLLPLAALAFRRGYLLALPLVLFIPPRPAQAFEWNDLWLRPDQRGQQALESGDAARAATLFEDPERKGAAQYRAEDYQSAVDTLSAADNTEALYNRGNALARLNRFDEAIAAYEEVLRRDPAHEDAAFNKALLEQQQPPPQQSGSGESPPEPQSGDQEQPDSGAQPGTDGDGDAQPGDRQPGEGRQAQRAEADADADGDTAEEKPASPEESTAEPTAEASPEDGDKRQPAQADDSATEGNEQLAQAGGDSELPDEEQLAAEQWLRRIPDDPGGLLRRKFRYQFQQRARTHQPEEQAW